MNFGDKDRDNLKQSMAIWCVASTIILVVAMTFLRRIFGSYFICTTVLAGIVWLSVTWFIYMVKRA